MKKIITANDVMEELINFITKEHNVLTEKTDIIATLNSSDVSKMCGEIKMLGRLVTLSREMQNNIS